MSTKRGKVHFIVHSLFFIHHSLLFAHRPLSFILHYSLFIVHSPFFPHADTLKKSRLNNLKELRAKTASSVFRVAFVFDETRRAILLVGGDKKGKNEGRFYRNLIKQAESIYYQYLADKKEE